MTRILHRKHVLALAILTPTACLLLLASARICLAAGKGPKSVPVQIKLAEGAFANEKEAMNATVATKAYFNFGPGAAVPVNISK